MPPEHRVAILMSLWKLNYELDQMFNELVVAKCWWLGTEMIVNPGGGVSTLTQHQLMVTRISRTVMSWMRLFVLYSCRLTFFTLVMVIFLSGQAVRVMVDYWLSVWVDGKYNLSSKVYVISYAAFVAGAIVFSLGRALLFTEAAMVSAKEVHGRMTESVLRSPQLFFDQVS